MSFRVSTCNSYILVNNHACWFTILTFWANLAEWAKGKSTGSGVGTSFAVSGWAEVRRHGLARNILNLKVQSTLFFYFFRGMNLKHKYIFDEVCLHFGRARFPVRPFGGSFSRRLQTRLQFPQNWLSPAGIDMNILLWRLARNEFSYVNMQVLDIFWKPETPVHRVNATFPISQALVHLGHIAEWTQAKTC